MISSKLKLSELQANGDSLMNRKVYLVKVLTSQIKNLSLKEKIKKGFSESMLNGNPLSSKFAIEILYIYMKIITNLGHGEIIDISEILRFDNIHQIIDFANQRKLDLSWVYTN